MKQFLVEENEKKQIRLMHKSLMKEDENKSATMTDEEKLRKAISVGCLTNGSLKRQTSTGKLYYKKASSVEPSKMVKFSSFTSII